MKRFFIFTALACTFSLQAQIVEDNAYLQSDFIEVGVNTYGNFITTSETPAGYVFSADGRGIIADADMDGWDTGLPAFSGDYVLSENPLEGFFFEHNGSTFANFGITDNILGSFDDYLSDEDTVRITWKGELPDLSGFNIFQEILLPKNELFALVRVTILNASFDFQYGIKYMRTINPSPEFATSGETLTLNEVIANFPLDPEAYVLAKGLVNESNLMGIVTRDPRAVVSYGALDGGSIYSVSDALSGNAPFNISGAATNDASLNIAFDLDSIYPCSAEMFLYAYVFSDDAEVVEKAMLATELNDYGALCTGVLYFDVNDVSYTSASVHFEAEDGMNYVIEYGPTSSEETFEFGTTDGTVALLGLTECTEYEVMVWSVCAGDTLPSISAQVFTTECTDTGTVNISQMGLQDLKLFPNPATDILFVEAGVNNCTIRITDISGNVLLEKTIQPTGKLIPIAIRDIPAGIYIFEMQEGDNLYKQQLIITR